MNVCLQKYLLCPTPAKEVDQEGSFDDKVACKGNRINEQRDFNSNYLSLQPEKDTYQQYEENMDTCSPDHLFVSSTLAVSNIRNRTYTNYEVYLIGYGYGKFKEKIHFME